MGEPITDTERIPVTAPGHRTLVGAERSLILEETVDWMLELHQIDENPLDQLGKTFSCVSMGNPHLVLWGEVEMEDPEDQLIGAVGPWLEDHPMFPQRTNVHIVQPLEPGRARMLTWERGSGITQACGTGACAAVVAGVLEQRLDRHTTVQVLGGELEIRWDEATDHVFMTGEAVDVFEGEWTDR
jgi:diaminopimelate epimerase